VRSPAEGVVVSDPTKVTYEIVPGPAYKGGSEAGSRPCGEYGKADSPMYFEYHPASPGSGFSLKPWRRPADVRRPGDPLVLASNGDATHVHCSCQTTDPCPRPSGALIVVTHGQVVFPHCAGFQLDFRERTNQDTARTGTVPRPRPPEGPRTSS
jgi:hypothetical protein